MSVAGDVESVLSNYARRGVFKSYSGPLHIRTGKLFRFRWHYDRFYEVNHLQDQRRVSFTRLLENVSGISPMARDLRRFVKSYSMDNKLPNHKRVDQSKARVRVYARGGQVTLIVDSIDGDMEYATKKLVNIAHEVLTGFLSEGAYLSYRVNYMGVNPDRLGI